MINSENKDYLRYQDFVCEDLPVIFFLILTYFGL